jgi:hypothetical protein
MQIYRAVTARWNVNEGQSNTNTTIKHIKATAMRNIIIGTSLDSVDC